MSLRLRALVVAVFFSACPGGLNTGKGNDFPCDFSQPEGVRDQVCSPGDVCGVDNRCRQYRYEGPQFDQGASAPRFEAPVVRHPLLVTEPVLAVTHGITPRDTQHAVAVVGTLQQGTAIAAEISDAITSVRTAPSPIPPGALTTLAVSNAPTGREAFVVALLRNNNMNVGAVFTSLDLDAGQQLPLLEGDRLRNGPSRIAVVRLDMMGPGAFEVIPGGPAQPRELDFDETLPDGGVSPQRVVDMRYLPGGFPADAGPDELLLTRDGLFLSHLRVAQRLSAPDEAMPVVLTSKARPRTDLRHDQNATIAAFTTYDDGEARVLSTWRLDRRTPASAVRAWPDCAPCGGQGRVMAFAPVLELGAPFVEVLCALPGGGGRSLLTLLRVTGSAAADELQACTVEQLEAPFLLGQVNELSRGRRAAEGVKPTAVFDEGFGAGVVLGGRRGQLWTGRSFSTALPLFLDRVPQAFGTIPSPNGGSIPAVLTDRYLAAPRNPALGYEVLDLSGTGGQLPAGAVGSAFVGQALGWGMASSGDLLLIDVQSDGGTALRFGPRLLDARGQAARGPFFGEAATAADGGLISFVLTADDSLYFTPAPAPGATTATPNVLEPLTPQLTPAPSSPIRSFALERSAVGTDGVTRVRGYVVAGRSLFVVQLSGTPPRWSATPIVLQGGEPLETWMDHPLGGLGRVGYRDGQVFTLPGGFLLVNELPRDAGTNPSQVLDYDNLGGWPVAMTSNGLFEAHYEVLDGGRLKNRFEDGGINRAMNWQRVTLPDGGEPWLGRPSRIHVSSEVRPYDPSLGPLDPPPARARLFRLLVYTDEQVIEVGTLVRRAP